MQDNFWKSLDVVKLLAIMIVVAWLACFFLKLSADQTMTNVVMIVVGFFFGSSAGSKVKDSVILGTTPPSAPPSA